MIDPIQRSVEMFRSGIPELGTRITVRHSAARRIRDILGSLLLLILTLPLLLIVACLIKIDSLARCCTASPASG